MPHSAVTITQHEVDMVCDFMRRTCGNDLSDKGPLVRSKVGMLCAKEGYRHFYEFWEAAQGTTIAAARLRQEVIDELTTNYSYFYREPAHFELISRLASSGDLPASTGDLRVWSAGCATGEEAYNVAMALEDVSATGGLSRRYRVVGSDISTKSIKTAIAGRYDVADVARMPPQWRNLYCVRAGQEYHIRSALRDRVEFRQENVFTPRPDSPFDIVICRNMMIYFDRESMERFCTLLRGRVRPGGYLLLGHTEIMSSVSGFTYIEPSVWRRNDTGGEDLSQLLAFR